MERRRASRPRDRLSHRSRPHGHARRGLSGARLMWTEPVADFDGRHYRLEQATCEPKPVQAHLPLMIGGSGERRTLRAVARYADRWNGSGSVARLTHSADVLRTHCAAEGRDPDAIALTVMNESH